jgi:uncharacterized protein YecE (DUF72 family)
MSLDLFGNPKGRVQGPQSVSAAAERLTSCTPAIPGLWLGCSSWSFPGWEGLVYGPATDGISLSDSRLASHGLAAYSQHPLLNAVGIDRSFYAPVPRADYERYASQTPEHFRFLVKAPEAVTSSQDRAGALNAQHLDARLAIDSFIIPVLEGLKAKALALVFQFSPMPRPWVRDSAHWITRLDQFLDQLPVLPASAHYAVELRDPELVTPRLLRCLASRNVRYCVALHDRMPAIERQAKAVEFLSNLNQGPCIVRWTLHPGWGYQQAKQAFAPFRALQAPDPDTRRGLAALCASTLRAGQAALVIVNNKAEGSAPLSVQALDAAIRSELTQRASIGG